VPPDWPYATAFVAVHLALTIISGFLIVREDSRAAAAARSSPAKATSISMR
jgi:hypothetical protein